MSNSPYLRES